MSCSRSPFTRLGYVSLRVMCPVIPVLPHYMIPSSHATFRTYYITSTRKSCTLHATPTYAVRHTVLPYKLSSLTPSQKPVLTMHIRTFNIALHIFTLLLFLLTDHITLLHFPSFTETFLYIKNMHLVPTFSSLLNTVPFFVLQDDCTCLSSVSFSLCSLLSPISCVIFVFIFSLIVV